MNNNLSSLSNRQILKQLYFLAFPVFITLFLQQLYNFLDSLIVNKLLGTIAFSAIGVSATIYNLFLFVIKTFSSKVSIRFTQFFSREEYLSLRQDVSMGFFTGAAICIVLSAVSLLALPYVFDLMNTPKNIQAEALPYLQVLLIGLVVAFGYNYVTSIYTAIDHIIRPVVILIISLAINLVLDWIFIAYFHMGTAGAAWATVISQFFTFAACYVDLLIHYHECVPHLKDLIFDPKEMKKMFKVGRNTMLAKLNSEVSKLLIQGIVNTLSHAAIAVYTAIVKVDGMLTSIGTGGSHAVSMMVAKQKGKGNIDQCHRILGLTCLNALALSTVAMIVTIVFSGPLMKLFFGNSASAVHGQFLLTIIAVSLIFFFLNSVFTGYFTGMDKMGVPFAAGIIQAIVWIFFSWIYLDEHSLTSVIFFWAVSWLISLLYQAANFMFEIAEDKIRTYRQTID